ncbi:WD-repeat protein [Penicillium sp. IBT 18751x]|nr:WD-repeat protein [Penicillium sp. IBT 18751x]
MLDLKKYTIGWICALTTESFWMRNITAPSICLPYNNLSFLIERLERNENIDTPVIHYGLIILGNSLIKDAMLRDKLAGEIDVLCFEIEAVGLMNNFLCLIIRSICDYSDSHKNKD